MGQWFQIFSIDDALYKNAPHTDLKTLGGSKLGEWFFYGTAEYITERLAASSDFSVSLAVTDEFARELIRGVWAGCTFDVVRLSELGAHDEEVKEELMIVAKAEEKPRETEEMEEDTDLDDSDYV